MIKKNFDFMSNRRMFWLTSLVVMTIGAIANILLGTQIDMRFTGGTVMRYSYYELAAFQANAVDASGVPTVRAVSAADVVSQSEVSVTDTEPLEKPEITQLDAQMLSQLISDALGVRAVVALNDVLSGSDSNEKTLVVTFTEDESALGHNADILIRRAAYSAYPSISLMLKESNSYSPILGREFFSKCVVAVVLAVASMLIILSARFRGSGGISLGGCGLLGVIHDLLIVYFAFVILRYPIDNNFIAAMLATIGYSLNTKIAIFGKIRENRKLFGTRLSVSQLANLSLNETSVRTLSTNLCLLIILGTLAIVSAIAGLESTLRFSLPMLFGAISGVYTSLVFSISLWVSWTEFRSRRRWKHCED